MLNKIFFLLATCHAFAKEHHRIELLSELPDPCSVTYVREVGASKVAALATAQVAH